MIALLIFGFMRSCRAAPCTRLSSFISSLLSLCVSVSLVMCFSVFSILLSNNVRVPVHCISSSSRSLVRLCWCSRGSRRIFFAQFVHRISSSSTSLPLFFGFGFASLLLFARCYSSTSNTLDMEMTELFCLCICVLISCLATTSSVLGTLLAILALLVFDPI